jgi:hypothetical protein
MLGRQRLREPEVVGERADEVLAVAETVEDRPSDRLRQHFEGGEHQSIMPQSAYAMQRINVTGDDHLVRDYIASLRSFRY